MQYLPYGSDMVGQRLNIKLLLLENDIPLPTLYELKQPCEYCIILHKNNFFPQMVTCSIYIL